MFAKITKSPPVFAVEVSAMAHAFKEKKIKIKNSGAGESATLHRVSCWDSFGFTSVAVCSCELCFDDA